MTSIFDSKYSMVSTSPSCSVTLGPNPMQLLRGQCLGIAAEGHRREGR